MSEIIKNKRDFDEQFLKRQEKLKSMILKLHEGVDEREVHNEFKEHFSGVSSYEITQMEQALMEDEGLEVEQIQNLCSIHANIFKGSIDEVHTTHREEESIGHPVRVMREENYALKELLEKMSNTVVSLSKKEEDNLYYSLLEDLALLWDIDKHYTRKEIGRASCRERV